MSAWNPELVPLRMELARIAMTPDGLQQRAEEMLQVLARFFPFDAGWLAVRDAEGRWHHPLATAGDAEPLRRNFARPDADAEVEQLGLNRVRPPMLARDIPYPLIESPTWAEYLLPAGFRGGVAAGLFTPGAGRHVGFLSLLSGDPSRPSSADRETIAAVSAVIAHGLDRTREIAETARIVEEAFAGAVITRGGDTLPLPGLPGHRLLAPGSGILAATVRELADSDTYITFLAPVTHADGDEELVRVTALNCARPELDHLAATAVLSPPGDLRGLTSFQLRVLGMVAQGVPLPTIASTLGVAARTVAEGLEEALVVLEMPDLTAGVVRAVRVGLRIPPALATSA